MPPRNPFAVLGLPLDATTDAIKAAWRRLAREHHPDVTSGDPVTERRATREMAEINAAYQELRDPEKRRVHRESAAREARAEAVRNAMNGHSTNGDGAAWAGAGGFPYGEPPTARPGGWVPRPRPTRPVTARIDTSELYRPRNSTLHPLSHSPLPGLPPRPRNAPRIPETPRASDPTGPTYRETGDSLDYDLPELVDAMELRLDFGKFAGRSLGEVALIEPTYIDWIVKTVVNRDPELTLAARVVLRYLERTGSIRHRRLDTETPARG